MEVNKIIVKENYVDEAFENAILKMVPNKKPKVTTRNQILRWGSSVPYDNAIVSKKIPPIFDRFSNDIGFDSVTLNEYYEGQTIGWHIDKPESGEEIYIISLLSDSNLRFRLRDEEVSFFVPRFSLCIFSEDLRWKWEHSLTANERRLSIVFRNSLKLK